MKKPIQFLTVFITFLVLSTNLLFKSPFFGFEKKPNFVFFIVDDLGYMDIGANNPNIFYETPNIDQLAREGMRFTNGYAANPVCSPTRYSIMTGRYPSRVDATNWFSPRISGRCFGRFLPAPSANKMPLSETTIAEALKNFGYQTAFIGKWHLGQTPEFWPEHQGFDINVGGHNWGSPPGGYFSPYENPRLEDGRENEYLTKRLTEESLKILPQFKDSPFFLYLSFYTVHTLLQAPKDLVEKYKLKATQVSGEEFATEEQVWPGKEPRLVRILQKHPTYAAMVEIMDTSIGKVLDKLQELGLDDNTVIIFMSDNGGLSTSEGYPTSNLPLRGGKGWLYEGGIREPFMIKWPGVTEPGSTSDVPVTSTDFYPTILNIAGLPANLQQHQDGESLVPLLKGKSKLQREELFWHYPHYSNQGGFPGGAIRIGKWKLIERFEDGQVHLYNLNDDLGELNDLAEVIPDRVHSMRGRLHAWYQKVDAKFLEAKEGGQKPWRPEL